MMKNKCIEVGENKAFYITSNIGLAELKFHPLKSSKLFIMNRWETFKLFKMNGLLLEKTKIN